MEDAEHVDLSRLINSETVQMALGYAKGAGFPEWDETFKAMILAGDLTRAIADGIVKIVLMGGPAEVHRVHDLMMNTEGQRPS